ncbi:uncharacterized protein JCM6883_005094 [Sporobolomyces salmoneus]|uniref:uncharacterized protein n=1 Tax=Sporobolomyces salmoneus TaxID=183962 RepID=UPI00316BC143
MSPTLRKKKSWKDLLRSPRLDPAEQPEVPKSPNPGYISDSSQRENKASKSTGSPYLSPEEFERRGSTFSSASAASEQQPFQARERTPSERTPSVSTPLKRSGQGAVGDERYLRLP